MLVLRRTTGDRIEIVDAGGVAFAATLEIADRTVHATLEVAAPAAATETASRIVLAQAIPKGQKMDFIVEKATELGVSSIVPLRSLRVIGERTGAQKHERWQRLATSAAAQSGRARIPAIEAETGWDGLLATFPTYGRVFVPWEEAPAVALRTHFEPDGGVAGSVLIVIGPEGGFAAGEIERARAAGAEPVSLGPRILRTETAALVVLAALLYARGEV